MNEYIKKHDDFDDNCLYFVANSPRMGFDACVMEFWMEDDEEEE